MNRKILLTFVALASICFGTIAVSACPSITNNGRSMTLNPNMSDCAYGGQQAGHNGSNGAYFIGRALQQQRAMQMRQRQMQQRQMMSRQHQGSGQVRSTVRIVRKVSRTHSAPVPSAQQIAARVPHQITRRWADCVAGYDQDPDSGDCTRTTWHQGPMPR